MAYWRTLRVNISSLYHYLALSLPLNLSFGPTLSLSLSLLSISILLKFIWPQCSVSWPSHYVSSISFIPFDIFSLSSLLLTFLVLLLFLNENSLHPHPWFTVCQHFPVQISIQSTICWVFAIEFDVIRFVSSISFVLIPHWITIDFYVAFIKQNYVNSNPFNQFI